MFTVHSQSLDLLKKQPSSHLGTSTCSSLAERASPLPYPSGRIINMHKLSWILVDILGSSFNGFHSFVIIHDDSVTANVAIQAYFNHFKMQTPVPAVTGIMAELQDDPLLIHRFLQMERIPLVVILFADVNITQSFLEIASENLSGPLLLLSLEEDDGARYVSTDVDRIFQNFLRCLCILRPQ